MAARILIVDLETLPMELLGYGFYEQNFGAESVLEHITLASFAAEWLDSGDVIYEEVNWRKNPRDDFALTKKLHALMLSADIVLGQNSISFDARVANERFLFHELGPIKKIQHIDTKRMAKRHFFLPSYSLEYMAGRYGDAKKLTRRKFHGIVLAKECLRKNPEAWEEMRAYNIADVTATKSIFKRYMPWGIPGIDLNAYTINPEFRCQCGSQNFQKRGFQHTANASYRQYQCKECRAWATDRSINLLDKEKRASLKGPIDPTGKNG